MGDEEHDERHAASTAYRTGSTTPTDRDRRGSGNSKVRAKEGEQGPLGLCFAHDCVVCVVQGRGGREEHAAPKDGRQAPPQDEEEDDEEGEGDEDDDESDGDDKVGVYTYIRVC
jgi:hypothetical protein